MPIHVDAQIILSTTLFSFSPNRGNSPSPCDGEEPPSLLHLQGEVPPGGFQSAAGWRCSIMLRYWCLGRTGRGITPCFRPSPSSFPVLIYTYLFFLLGFRIMLFVTHFLHISVTNSSSFTGLHVIVQLYLNSLNKPQLHDFYLPLSLSLLCDDFFDLDF